MSRFIQQSDSLALELNKQQVSKVTYMLLHSGPATISELPSSNSITKLIVIIQPWATSAWVTDVGPPTLYKCYISQCWIQDNSQMANLFHKGECVPSRTDISLKAWNPFQESATTCLDWIVFLSYSVPYTWYCTKVLKHQYWACRKNVIQLRIFNMPVATGTKSGMILPNNFIQLLNNMGNKIKSWDSIGVFNATS